MPLDPLTLLATNILVMMLVSASYGLAWLDSRRQPALLWMLAAGLTTALGLAVRVTLPSLPAIVLSNALVGAAAVSVWMACRSLAGRAVRAWALGVPLALWIGLVCVPGFLANVNARLVAANLVLVVMFGLSAREVLRLPADRPFFRLCVATLLLFQATVDLAWLIFNLVTPASHGTDIWQIRGLAFIDITTLVFSLLMAFSMIVLIREAAERHYRRAALVDGLTGVGNRRSLDESLAPALAEARRRGRPMGLIMLDVDGFKSYNDLYGHLKGDACLRAVARALQGALPRPEDGLFRYGGEEFAVVLPDLGLADAIPVAERLRLAVRGLRLLHGGGERGVVTVSLGVAATAAAAPPSERQGVADPGQDFAAADAAALMSAADRALYQAKALGRDRVVADDAALPGEAPSTAEIAAAEPRVARPRHRVTGL
jgi:diguanylate cyclase (GGDEF)-like protein